MTMRHNTSVREHRGLFVLVIKKLAKNLVIANFFVIFALS